MNPEVARFMERLLVEFPDWTTEQAYIAAVRIVTVGQQQAFQLECEQGLADIPVTEVHA